MTLEDTTNLLTDLVREAAHPLVGEVEDYDPLLKLIGDSRLVLIGEASHGTHEFYRERALGVIYRPETERQNHYFLARLSDQFDAVVHFDETRAVEPLERSSGLGSGRSPGNFSEWNLIRSSK